MPSFRDLFPERWLKPHVINGFRPRVVIDAVTIEEVFNPRIKKTERKFAVKFHGKELRMLLNKTNAMALADICKTEDYTRWVGHEVVLWVGRAPNGKDTIIIGPVPDAKSAPPPPERDADHDPFGDDDMQPLPALTATA